MAVVSPERSPGFDMPAWLRSALVFGLIYTFLVGVSALEKGIKIMGEDTQERLFSSVSNTLVSLGHIRQSNEFKRAFAAATLHDFLQCPRCCQEHAQAGRRPCREVGQHRPRQGLGNHCERCLDHIVSRSVDMLGDARHSFDLATLALLTNTDTVAVEADVRSTDQRINHMEQQLHAELVVHVTVQGSSDIGSVLGMILRGVRLAGETDTEAMLAERGLISTMSGEAADLLSEPERARVEEFATRVLAVVAEHQAKVESYLHSERPGREVVPRGDLPPLSQAHRRQPARHRAYCR